jgi:O-antigen ligase
MLFCRADSHFQTSAAVSSVGSDENIMNTLTNSSDQMINPGFQVPKLLTVISFLVVLLITSSFALYPMKSWTVLYYLVIGYLLIAHSKTGIITLALSYHIIITSFAALTGNYLAILFYGVFIIPVLAILYANVIGFTLRMPSLSIDKYLLFMILYLTISVFFITPERSYGGEKLRTYFTNIILCYLPIFLVKDKSDFVAIAKGITCFGVFFTGFCILSIVGLETYYGAEIHGRFSTLGLNTIWVARHLTYAILAELFLIRVYFAEPSKNLGKISLLVFLILLQTFLAFLTGSRGPLLSIILALAFIFLISVRLRIFYLVLITLFSVLIILAAIYFMPSHISERLLTRDHSSQVTIQLRLAANLQALDMFWQNKIFGAGLGSFAGVSPLPFPHNVFSETLAELGLIGFSIFMAILLTCVSYLVKMSKSFDKPILYLLIALLITSIVNINFGELIGVNFYLYLTIGLIYAARVLSMKQDQKTTNERT